MGNVVKYKAKNTNTNSNNAVDEDRVPAKAWLNLGTVKKITDPESGDVTEEFTALVTGIPLDTMPDAKSKGPKGQAQNGLRDQLVKRIMKMEPGDTFIPGDKIMGLSIQLRRVRENEQLEMNDNPYAVELDLG